MTEPAPCHQTALNLVAKYGTREAHAIATHYAFNNYDKGDPGRAYWLEVARIVYRMNHTTTPQPN